MWHVFKRREKTESVAAAAPSPIGVEGATPAGHAPQPPRTGNGIAYDPTLIDKLKDDHAALFALHRTLFESVAANRFDAIPDDLLLFRRAFQTHLLVESVRFYIYLEKLLVANPDELAYARSLKHEMNGIAKTVGSFIETWSTRPPTAQTARTFVEQLNAIGQAFAQRVEVEESTLYTLYVESL